jgi:MFS family permease
MATILASVGSMLFSRVETKLGVRQTFAAALLCAAIGVALLGVAPSAWVAGVACGLAGMGIGLYIPHLWVLPTTLELPSMQAHAIGLLNTSMYLGGFLSPILMGGLQKVFGINGALVAVGALLALASAGILMARRTRLADGAVTEIA